MSRRPALVVLAALMLIAWIGGARRARADDPKPDPAYTACVDGCREEDHVHCERDCKTDSSTSGGGTCTAMFGSYRDTGDCVCVGEVKPGCENECAGTSTTSASRSSCAIAW